MHLAAAKIDHLAGRRMASAHPRQIDNMPQIAGNQQGAEPTQPDPDRATDQPATERDRRSDGKARPFAGQKGK
jgi:hypothetical protein